MSDSYKIENNAIAGEDDIGSMNHNLAQARLTSLLDDDERFTVMTEFSCFGNSAPRISRNN
jgi:hypothetical protein